MLSLPLSERNLILTGYIGPNQPLIGRMIADKLKMPYVNVEFLIAERTGLSVDELRAYYGEARLKNIETEIISETWLRRSTVIRVSARTLLHGDALKRLSDTGPIFCTVTTIDAMLQRLHVAMGARFYAPDERAFELANIRREWAVRGSPGVIELDTTYFDAEQTVTTIIERWQTLAITRA